MSNQNILETTARMNPEEVEELVLHLMRCESVRDAGSRAGLGVQHFSGVTELKFAVMWRALIDLVEAGTEVTYLAIRSQVSRLLDDNPEYLPQPEEDDLMDPNEDGFLFWCFNAVDDAEINEERGLNLLREYLGEREILESLEQLVKTSGSGKPTDLTGQLRIISEKQEAIQSVQTDPAELAFPEDFSEPVESRNTFTTGVDFLDNYMDGQCSGECYGLLGPFGSGKTLLAAQIAVQGAYTSQMLTNTTGVPLRHWTFISYEMGLAKLKPRLWSYGGDIHIDSLKDITDLRTLSRRGDLKPYELAMYAEDIRQNGLRSVPGEYERLENARDALNLNFKILDYTGGRRCPTAGAGWLQEIVAWLERQCAAGRKPGGIVIDYAGKMARRNILAQGKDLDRNMRHAVGTIGEQAIQMIAEPFDIPVWILHQFNTAANKKGPAALLHHADAQEAGNFGEPMDYCFCLGNKDKTSGCLRINASKNRHTDGREMPPLISVAGEFSRLVRTTEWVFDNATQKIVSAELQGQWHGSGTPQQQRPGGNRQSSVAGLADDALGL